MGFLTDLLKRELKPFDASVFNDPIATQTDWKPLKYGGNSFQSHKLAQVGANRLEFKMTTTMKLIPAFILLFFVLIGGAVFLGDIMEKGLSFLGFEEKMILGLIVVIFLFFIIFVLVKRKAIIFDKNYGYYWKGKRDKQGMIVNPSEFKESANLSDIHALQIISERVHSNKTSFTSYELNLVLNSGKRMNVIDHSNLTVLREDAQMLSQFLSVPVWDAVQK